MGNYLFLQIALIVCLVSLFTSIFNKRFLNLPPPIGVPIVSAVLVFILQWATGLLNGNEYVTINMDQIKNTVKNVDFYDFLINGVICFVLTASALKFKISDLKKHWKPISLLATVSLALCALLFGSLLFGFQYVIGSPVPILVLLLLGSALGATDPIGIKGVLSSVKAPHHLMVKLEGESLFNDAMCIALFMTILSIIKGGVFTVFGAIEHLLFEVVIAGIIGYSFGRFALFLLKEKNDFEVLILITAAVATGSYLIALYAHASAPIACVIAGLIVGNKWQDYLEHTEVEEVNHFWHTIENLINAFLFTLIGLELFILDLDTALFLSGIVAFILLHLSRFASNYLTFFFFPSIRKNSYNGSLAILSWGGVRGGISLALILAVMNVPALQPYSSLLLGYTFISVLLSGVVCGLGLPSMLNAFYYNPNEPKEGLSGFYQKFCNLFNRKDFKYLIETDKEGHEHIIIYDPESHIKTISIDLEKESTTF